MGEFNSYPSNRMLGDIPPVLLQDIYDWTGSVVVNDGQWFNFKGVSSLVKNQNSNIGSLWDGVNLKLPPVDGWSQLVFSVRISGSIAGSSPSSREWMIQIRRPDGNTVVASSSTVKVSGNDISNRDSTIASWTYGSLDNFTVNGFSVGISNASGQAITLTSISIRIQRIVNQ